MSFILDALRRADRERESERGGVPSLYTQAAPLPTSAGPGVDGSAPRPWLWLAAGLGGGLVLAAVWALWSATPSASVAPAVMPAPAPGPVVVPAPVVTAPPAPPAPPAQRAEPASAPPVRQATPRAEPPAEPRPEPARASAKPPPDAAPRVETKPVPPRPAPVAERPAATPATPPPSARAAPPLRQIDELSAEQRGALPKLTIGGAMYSSSASSRRLIVNGQLLSEGEAVAPGVTIEEIRLKSVVLRTRDLRYELGF